MSDMDICQELRDISTQCQLEVDETGEDSLHSIADSHHSEEDSHQSEEDSHHSTSDSVSSERVNKPTQTIGILDTEHKLTLPEEVWENLQMLHQNLIQATHKNKRDAIYNEIKTFYKKHLRNPIKTDKDEEPEPEMNDAVKSEIKEKQKKTVIETLKQSLKNTQMTQMQDFDVDNFANLEQSKTALFNVKSRLDYHHRQAIFYAVQSGKVLAKIKEMCIAENKNFADQLNDWGIKWSVSHRNFLIDLYYFSRNYPRIVSVSVSLFYFKANFNKIKSIVYASSDEKKFWRYQEHQSPKE